jgi:hypothetical protein
MMMFMIIPNVGLMQGLTRVIRENNENKESKGTKTEPHIVRRCHQLHLRDVETFMFWFQPMIRYYPYF